MNNENFINELSDNIIRLLNTKLSLKTAKEIIERAESKAEELNIAVTITILDDGGNLIAQHRMDNSLLISIDASFSKAYTSVAMKIPTEEVYNIVQPGSEFYGLENISPGRICVFGGGLPIINNGKIIGAIGVSGGTSQQDVLIAKSSII
ncbi:MAG: heme-binding protein [Clostridium butyricum]|uniref:GlcG/HbpS family heme-binding protein n=1 Tax=Clostridium butyricum TaxID=1492 RepID=UPI002104E2F9|nr:heme-binding protein [Clostridium butyricum]MCQ2013451.1 heme-binding protein [Clostridium butyricum]MCQ2027716.1 heme-binding protein [Clostridium butyricum]MDU4750840.1 heme-binding protein [Clostridium butyricum]MDU4853164.1 heme-binding protein [Clostridioides difficile]